MNSSYIYALPSILLYAFLVAATYYDVKSRRIPNILVFPAAFFGVALHSFLPSGTGFFSDPFGGLGIASSLAGFGTGLAIFLPMYILKTMGAGDVKMLAAVGAFFGVQQIVLIALLSMLIGGLLAVSVATWNGMLFQVISNIRIMILNSLFRLLAGASMRVIEPSSITGKLPYAIAITGGTMLYVATAKTGIWDFLL